MARRTKTIYKEIDEIDNQLELLRSHPSLEDRVTQREILNERRNSLYEELDRISMEKIRS